MKTICTYLFLLIFSISSAIAETNGVFSINQTIIREEISYKLPLTTKFETAFYNALKTGNVVKVTHNIKIRDVNQWIGWMAQKQYSKFYKYNLINDRYYIGVTKDNLKSTIKKDLLNDLTSLNNAPFLPKNILQKGNAYVIDFSININPVDNESSTKEKFLIFKGDNLKESIHSAVHYIVK